jgi:hypothetical protein
MTAAAIDAEYYEAVAKQSLAAPAPDRRTGMTDLHLGPFSLSL